ncbi:protein tyrosine phosphatase [Serratia marcescens]|nr:protein tyrosine phosphatase [Serratia marcescens]MBH2706244.1 protein tyrosine phosphatase [Serratia marcescens]MBH2729896.1 protein tyrosine phosphatase [Serratia marcescens]MBH2867335.1 protein tyrosine phosphatase [Serratia marcescens]MBH3188873.1 protein tyrosine phosphatase [Serratia marcescens]
MAAMKFDSILVICVGNICRSPTGEALLRQMLPGKKVASAGLQAVVGEGADANAKITAEKHGVSLDGHVARQLTSALCREYDLILVMEKRHIDMVGNIAPEVRGKTMLFGHWMGQQEIDDPYRKSLEAFEYVYQMLSNSASKWAKVLAS